MQVRTLRPAATQPYPVGHDLRLDLDAVQQIAATHTGSVEAHEAQLPTVHPSGHRRSVNATAASVVAGLADAASWITLFDVRHPILQPVRAALVEQLVIPGQPEATVVLSLICSSAAAVTPAHQDVADVLLLQLLGRKRFSTGCLTKRAERAELRRRFGYGENLHGLPERQQQWLLGPGDGVFVPAYTPHWAEVDDEVSVALSVAISTPRLRYREQVHEADAALARRGIRLPAPGRSRALDGVRVSVVRLGRKWARSLPKRAGGQ